jgi:heme oxygenase
MTQETTAFSALLKESTKDDHRIVETKTIMKSLMKGTLPLDNYCHLLAGLFRIYTTLESCLDKHSNHPIVSQFYFKELYRSESLKQDLKFFNYTQKCNCSSVSSICNRIQILSETAPERLVAYAYVRYLGDLSGGVFLARKVVKVYNLVSDSEGSQFYQFPGIEDGNYFKNLYRSRLDDIPLEFQNSILEETIMAFKCHGPLFDDMLLDCVSQCTLLTPTITATVKSIGLTQMQAHLALGIITSVVAISLIRA